MMEDFVRLFSTSEGDIYHITLSEDTTILSEGLRQFIQDIKLIGIDLRRLAGNNATNQSVLVAIEKVIADFFLSRDDVMIFYYCDFLNPIPKTLKNAMPPQEYRSRLFEKMFQRYTKHHGIHNVRLSVFTVEGIGETYYFHLIYRDVHALYAAAISQDVREGLSKPE